MRITKEPQTNANIINTLRNLNKLNPSANIDLSNIHKREIPINNETSNLIKVKLMKNNNNQISPHKKLPINFIYNDKKINTNQKEINNLRHSLIFTQEKLKENIIDTKQTKGSLSKDKKNITNLVKKEDNTNDIFNYMNIINSQINSMENIFDNFKAQTMKIKQEMLEIENKNKLK